MPHNVLKRQQASEQAFAELEASPDIVRLDGRKYGHVWVLSWASVLGGDGSLILMTADWYEYKQAVLRALEIQKRRRERMASESEKRGCERESVRRASRGPGPSAMKENVEGLLRSSPKQETRSDIRRRSVRAPKSA